MSDHAEAAHGACHSTARAIAAKGLKTMGPPDADRLRAALQQVADTYPRRQPFVTEMVGMPGVWRARKGDFRAIFTIEGDTLRVTSIVNRKDIHR